MDRKIFGELGEKFAAGLLEADGYSVLDRNYRCKLGEVDIVCGKGAELCFVEVKTRKNTSMGYPAEAVNSNKLRHIKNVAEYYVQNKKIKGKFISFKVVEIIAGVISDIV